MDRLPVVAGMFYPAGERQCRREIEAYLRAAEIAVPGRPIVGGLVPHAGWTFSGATAAHVYAALGQQEPPETVVFFGAVHSWGVTHPSVYPSGAWHTPLGPVQVDSELAERCLAAPQSGLISSIQAHAEEHSIEVQLPFVKYLFPEAQVLPIATPPTSEAARAAHTVATAVRELNRRAVAIGSTDLTHYGPRYGLAPVGVGPQALDWIHENDARVLRLAEEMAEDMIIGETQARHNACGAGAIVAAIAYSKEMGATQGLVLHYTTSHEVFPQGMPSDMVGYGAVVFF